MSNDVNVFAQFNAAVANNNPGEPTLEGTLNSVNDFLGKAQIPGKFTPARPPSGSKIVLRQVFCSGRPGIEGERVFMDIKSTGRITDIDPSGSVANRNKLLLYPPPDAPYENSQALLRDLPARIAGRLKPEEVELLRQDLIKQAAPPAAEDAPPPATPAAAL